MISAVIFDLDGTLTLTPNPWRHIHEVVGVWENGASGHLDEWLSGRVDYDEFCRKDTVLWQGRSLREIHGYLDRIAINRHVPEVAASLAGRGIPSIIISSGFDYVARKIQTRCNWEPLLIYANELTEGPGVTIRVSPDPASPLSKKSLAEAGLALVGSRAEEALVVSDTERDLEQLCHCGFQLHVRGEDDLLETLRFLR